MQTITVETITAGHRATGLVLFAPERVLEGLGPAVEFTPSPQDSQSSWDPKTPKTLPDVKKQPHLTLTENRQRRRSSASSTENPFPQLLKGFETVVHEKALLMAENAALKAENRHQKQKRARTKGYLQQGGPMNFQDGQDAVHRRVVTEQSQNNTENFDPALLAEPPRGARTKAPSKCSKCNSLDHNARTCSL